MINKKKADKIPVSIVIPMRNSETTIIETLSSLNKQNHPIREIYIIDNVSKDNSIKLVNDFRNKNKKIPIFILINKHNLGVGGSYNKGVKKAKSPLIVLMHSDSSLTSSNELGLLVGPFYRNKNVVATYSTIILPRRIWNTYNFWQKVLSARAVDKKQPGLNGKFDCILRKEFLKIGGFNVKEYGHHMNIGAED